MKRIASVHFAAVSLERPTYAGLYKIPAVARDAAPYILNIGDKVQIWQTVATMGKQIRRETILAREIALDCIRMWTQNVLGASPQCHPGIWIVRDEIAVMYEDKDADGNPIWKPRLDADNKQIFRPATDEEQKQMFDEDHQDALVCDANYAELLVGQADEWFASSNTKDRRFIGDLHKAAAKAYGREREWLRSFAQSDLKACPVCKTMNPRDAMKCQKCAEIIDAAAYRDFKRRNKEIMESDQNGEPLPKGRFYPCNDCGAEFLNQKELVKHRLDCTKKPANAEAHVQPA